MTPIWMSNRSIGSICTPSHPITRPTIIRTDAIQTISLTMGWIIFMNGAIFIARIRYVAIKSYWRVVNCKNIFLGAALAFHAHQLSAQTTLLPERLFYASSIEAAVSTLKEEKKAVFTGPEYKQYFVNKGNDGHPFFMDMRPEWLIYDGVLYSSVFFVYDIFFDRVIVARPDTAWVSLNNSKISEFSLGGHRFKRIVDRNDLPGGFYEILFTSNNILLAVKWSKAFKASVWKEEANYVMIDENVSFFRSKKQLLKILNDRQTEIRNYIHKNNLDFKANKSLAFTSLVRYYSSLKNQ